MPDPTNTTPRPVGLGGIRGILRELPAAPVAAAPVEAPRQAPDRYARASGLGGIRGILADLNGQGTLPPTPAVPDAPPPLPPPAPRAESPAPAPSAGRPWSPLNAVREAPPAEAPVAKPVLPTEGATKPGPAKPQPESPAPKPVQAAEPSSKPVAPKPKPEVAPAKPEAPAPKPPAATGGDAFQRTQAHSRFAGVAQAGRPLASGAQGPAVVALQEALMAMAFAIPAGATGSYGPQTAQAVKNFQAFAGLPRTGVADAATWRALERLAPPAGQNAWDPGADPGPIPSPVVGPGKKARVVVSIGQHRAFLFDKAGKLVKMYAVRTGREGLDTKPGLKVVDGKNDNPKEISDRFWPDAGGRAFGDRLLGLTNYDAATGKKLGGSNNGHELHGTDQEASIGRDFSHGCVGLTNADISEIYDAVSVGSLVRFDP